MPYSDSPPGSSTRPAPSGPGGDAVGPVGLLAAAWGIGGVVALLGFAVWRLGGHALEMLSGPLTGLHWAALGAWVVFMAYSEGYRGFQHAFSPRTAARARHLAREPRLLHALLAPAFCMGFFHATRRRLIVTYALTSTIVGFVVLARQLAQPWRGIVDAGVVVGLVWGIASLLVCAFGAFTGSVGTASPELPERDGAPGASARRMA